MKLPPLVTCTTKGAFLLRVPACQPSRELRKKVKLSAVLNRDRAMPNGEPPPLDKIALLSLEIGRKLLEWGANAWTVRQAIKTAAETFGCTKVEVYCQHAAVMVMLRRGSDTCMQMGKVGEHGINLRRAEAVLRIVDDIAAKKTDCDAALVQIGKVLSTTGVYPVWLVCLATGLACAAFGRLLGAEPISALSICAGASVGQYLRHSMLSRKMNLFLMVATVSFSATLISGLVGRLLGDHHLDITAVASILLLVPGPAILNTQVDAMDGRPNLAAARALRVVYILLFMTLGFVLARQLVCI